MLASMLADFSSKRCPKYHYILVCRGHRPILGCNNSHIVDPLATKVLDQQLCHYGGMLAHCGETATPEDAQSDHVCGQCGQITVSLPENSALV